MNIYLKIFYTAVAILLMNTVIFSQGSIVNPFDMLYRIDKDKILITTDKQSNQQIFKTRSDNPFEVYDSEIKTIESISTPEKESIPLVGIKPISQPDIAKKISVSYIFWIILGILVYLAFLATIFRQYLAKIFKAFFNENILNHLQREWNSTTLLPYLAFYSVFILTAGVSIFLIMNYFNSSSSENLPSHWIWFCIGGVGLLVALKHLVLNLIGLIFPIYKSMESYIFTLAVFNQVTGLILIPFILLIAFVSSGLAKMIILGMLSVLILIYLFRSFRGFIIGSKFLVSNKFHFFMYLCAVEIAPIIILLKLVLVYN